MSSDQRKIKPGRGGAGTVTSSRLPSRPLTRVCKRCGKRKPLTNVYFARHAHNKWGLRWKCKKCYGEMERERSANLTAEQREAERERARARKALRRDEINAKSRQRYATDAEFRKRQNESSIAANRRMRLRRTEFLGAIKSKFGCLVCGLKDPHSRLQFHHVNPLDKYAELGQVTSMTAVKYEAAVAEVAKCVVLCLQCHADYHRRIINIRKKDMEAARRALARYVKSLDPPERW